ncbi:hypothetical protein [Paraburkholderia strydomiana]
MAQREAISEDLFEEAFCVGLNIAARRLLGQQARELVAAVEIRSMTRASRKTFLCNLFAPIDFATSATSATSVQDIIIGASISAPFVATAVLLAARNIKSP